MALIDPADVSNFIEATVTAASILGGLSIELIARLFQSSRFLSVASITLATATGIAILGFGAPPVVLALVAWGSTALFAPLYSWSSRRVGRW
jgi:hypothetical protein